MACCALPSADYIQHGSHHSSALGVALWLPIKKAKLEKEKSVCMCMHAFVDYVSICLLLTQLRDILDKDRKGDMEPVSEDSGNCCIVLYGICTLSMKKTHNCSV